MNINVMLKQIIRQARTAQGLKAREVAQQLQIDQALVSKFESGERVPTEEQLEKLAQILQVPYEKLAVAWLRAKIFKEVRYSQYAIEALNMVREDVLQYQTRNPIEYSANLDELLQEIDKMKKQLDAVRNKDNFRIAQALELEYTFESNRIEGNTLTLRETDLVVNEGLTVSGKSLREHLEAINHKDAIHYMKDIATYNIELNQREVLGIHNLILRGIHPEDAGRYRDVQVMIKGSAHIPPSPLLVRERMDAYFDWYRDNHRKVHPVVLAAEMHEKLVTIHPFIDGNGRTARLVMNLILLRYGFVIANIKGDYDTRMAYYTALESVQTGASPEAFRYFIAQVVKSGLERYLTIVDA